MTDHLREFRDNIARLFMRDLAAFRREIEAYPDDEAPWREIPGIANCGGTLALHIAGNLQYLVGAILGDTGYVRHRDIEFSRRGVSRAELMDGIDVTTAAVRATMLSLDPARLNEPYPIEVVNTVLRTDRMLLHLVTHLTYHTGQVDYHRRAATQSNVTVGTVSVPAMNDPWP